MMSDKQLKMVQFSEQMVQDNATDKKMSQLELENKWRRQVYEAIERLCDTINESSLLQILPKLDVGSWNEILEERFIAHQCGIPTCNQEIIHRKPQMYHVDRKDKKIYERCTEKHKFCSPVCHRRFLSLRSQLCAYPLWLTGETSDRFEKTYVLNIEEVPHSSEVSASNTVEIVAAEVSVVNALNELKIRDRDDDSTAEESDECEEAIRLKDTDKLAVNIQNFIKVEAAPVMPRSQPVHVQHRKPSMRVCRNPPNPRLPDLQQTSTANLKFSVDEDEKLRNLRSKYSRLSTIKAPIMVDAAPLKASKVGEVNRAQRVKTIDMASFAKVSWLLLIFSIDYDGELVSQPSTSNTLDTDAINENLATDGLIEEATKLLSSWWSTDSVKLLERGPMKPASDIDRIMRLYLQGETCDSDLETIRMPRVDCSEVKKKQIEILIHTIKPVWREMEQKLKVKHSTATLLNQLISTLALQADTIAGFERQLLRIVAIVLFRIICRLDSSLDDDFFPGGHCSREVQQYLDSNSIQLHSYEQVCNHLLL